MSEANNMANLLHELECRDCVFHTALPCSHRRNGRYCESDIHDAANLIEFMAAELEQVMQERDGLSIMLTSATSAAETYKRERDAAVRTLKDSVDACEYCIKWECHDMCNKWQECSECCGFEWRGLCKENGGANDD